MTAIFLLIDSGLLSTVRGWVRRAQRMLDGEDECAVHTLIAAVLGYERFFSGDLVEASRLAGDAVRLGEQFDVMSAVAMGRTATGRISVMNGEIDEGLAQLDEVAALLMSGEVDDLTVGMMFCELICAAQSILRSDLAQEWTDAMHRWGATGAVGAIRGRCRVHQAELLRQSGPGDAAERAALQACEELRPWLRREFGWPLVELGLARLRRGDLSGAEEAFTSAAEHSWPAHPGLALLHLEQGNVATASQEITDAIAHPVDAPSKELPPFGDLRLVALVEAQSEIALAAGDVVTAADAATKLRLTSAKFRSPALGAVAALAAARHALLAGDAQAAVDAASAATSTFALIEAPFDVARAQLVLADAHDAGGDATAARGALAASRASFARYGSPHRVAAIDARLHSSPPSHTTTAGASPLTGILRQEGATWSLVLAGNAARVKNMKGLRYLRRMVAEPGREFHVLDLVAVESGTLRAAGAQSDGIPVLDEAARAAYRRRLADIDDDIEEANRHHDIGRVERATADRDYLIAELTRAAGFGGRARETGDSAERARTAVTRTLRYAIEQLAADHRPAADHFRRSIRTGTYCSYEPDPLTTVTWSF